MLPDDDCGECGPAGLERRNPRPSTIMIAYLPFFFTFLVVATVVLQRLFPLLSGEVAPKVSATGSQLFSAVIPQRSRPGQGRPSLRRRASAFTFSATIALSAVLAELILCEISDTVNPVARALALRFTIFLLLVLLVVVIPNVEIHSIISAAGYKYTGPDSGRLKLAWLLHALVSCAWLMAFWWGGKAMLPKENKEKDILNGESWMHLVTEHVGVIGISLMALLSGFASVSAPWQSFGVKPRPVSETTIARKQAGLDSTHEMLGAKRSRLRALEQKLSESGSSSFFQKAVGTLRGNSDMVEKKNLEMEINGLENMALSLSTHHSILSSRLQQQNYAKTALGRAIRMASFVFSLYCLYRLGTMSLTFVRRRMADPARHFVGSDPINNILALLVRHYDSKLDRQAWTRQISFLLTGVMLFASFSSVLQTFHFFARYAPGLLKATQRNLALIVAQVCATYVISVALLLRGIMPGEVVGTRLRDLGGDDMQWVDGWFEMWFLLGAGVTIAGIWLGRKIAGIDEWDDEEDVEMGGKIH